MKRESIFFTVTVSFVLSILLVIGSFVVILTHIEKEVVRHTAKKYLPVARMILQQNRHYGLTKGFLESLSNMDIKFIKDVKEIRGILSNPKTKIKLENRYQKHILIRVLKSKGNQYLYIQDKNVKLLLKDEDFKNVNPVLLIILIFAGVFLTLLVSFLTTIRKLYPLKILKDKVKTLGDENFDFECCNMKGKDEVSQLAMEFKKTAQKLQKVKDARNVFIRNIMHELKTPITKGKFLSELEQSEKNDEKMKNVFNRLELLITEFTSIEELISSTKNIEKNAYFLSDIFDDAIDTLMLDEDLVKMEHENQKIEVNFKLFSVAVKNLIDNAIKYSSDKKVTIKTEENSIIFENHGVELEHPLENYFEPFFAKKSTTKNSFGLGLYIVNAILRANSYELKYEYKDEKNIFKIVEIKQT